MTRPVPERHFAPALADGTSRILARFGLSPEDAASRGAALRAALAPVLLRANPAPGAPLARAISGSRPPSDEAARERALEAALADLCESFDLHKDDHGGEIAEARRIIGGIMIEVMPA